jgi:hypothetical protein
VESRTQMNIGERTMARQPDACADDETWFISIYAGDTLFGLKPALVGNPVLSARDVSDADAVFVADPFMVNDGGAWHMFFEVLLAGSEKGEIGWAASDDGLAWSYQQIVLKEPFHLSYPYVFSIGDEYYMIPESTKSKAVRLYHAENFPDKWSFVANILDGLWADPSVFFFKNRWWMFVCHASPKNDGLALFYADDIRGPWLRHSMNPLIDGDNRIARPAGRVIADGDRLIRFAQDCNPAYGTSVRALEISELSPTSYREHQVQSDPILKGGGYWWNREGMHHVDPHRVEDKWLACVDGWRFGAGEHEA